MATDITLSLANSVRFAEVNALMDSFGNTLFADEDFHGLSLKEYFCQTYVNGDTLLVQIKADTAATVVLTQYNEDGSTSVITEDDTTAYAAGGFTVYDYTISLSTGDEFYLIASSETSEWQSEPITIKATLDGYLKVEWFNNDPMVANENFEFDYSTTEAQANVNFLYLKANLFKYANSGESEIFDNQSEKIKLKQNLYRQLTLETGEIPRYLAEQLQIAMAHDNFIVNDIAYVLEDLAESDVFGKTNMVTLSASLVQANILGFNTHDIGYDCDSSVEGGSDSMIENKVLEDASANGSFSVSDGFAVTQIVAIEATGETDGDVTLKVGNGAGLQNILYETAVPIHSAAPLIVNTRYTPDISGAWTVYYTLGGATPKVDLFIQTIKYIQ